MKRSLAILSILILCGCNHSHRYTEGRIIETTYYKPYTTLIPMHVGKIVVMSPQHHPARYELRIEVRDTITRTLTPREYKLLTGDKIIVER